MVRIKKWIAWSLIPMLAWNTLPGFTQTKAETKVTELAGVKSTANAKTMIWSTTYKDPEYANPLEEQPWREGLVTGNGEIGAIESQNPLNDVIIYQHIKYSFPNNRYHETPKISGVMEEVKQSLVENKRTAANKMMVTEATNWVKDTYGSGSWSIEGSYSFHPGHQLRMQITDQTTASDYRRFTNMETAEIGAVWTDEQGREWNRKTFSSRSDHVTYTYLVPVDVANTVNMDITIDNISDMANENSQDGSVGDARYRKIVDENGTYIAQVMHYPNYPRSDLKNGGTAGVSRVYALGSNAEQAYVFGSSTVEDIHEEDRVSNSKIPIEPKINIGSDKNPMIRITNANAVLIVTKSNRTKDMGTFDEFVAKTDEQVLKLDCVQSLLNDTEQAYEKNLTNDTFDYEKALSSHTELHQEIFNRVTFDLGADEADRQLTNEELLAKQKENPDTMNLALAERAFFNGRYANVCCSGYQVPRLGGMWTGAWHVEWSGDYTTDANINLQVAGSNIGNMKESIEGLLNMLLRISPDMMNNAYQIHGIEDAFLAPPRTDGDTGELFHWQGNFPGHMWNAGASWLMLPVYEYYKCYGNTQIPLVDDIRDRLEECRESRLNGTYQETLEDGSYKPVKDLQEILQLSDERVSEILETGYFDFVSDLLRPMFDRTAALWTGLLSPKYYMNTDGEARYDADKTALKDGESYLIVPSYSPENGPADSEGEGITINAAMDIASARDSMQTAIALQQLVYGEDADNTYIEMLEEYVSGLPEYQYEPTKEVKEWSLSCYPENHGHRHISHLYGVWPAHESETDTRLAKGAKYAIKQRAAAAKDGVAGHSWVHKGLVETRLKDSEGVSNILNGMLSSQVFYTSMMTAHNIGSNGSNKNALGLQAYCTDSSITLPAIMLESLVYSDTGVIELLPALPEEWHDGGSVSGMVARTRATVDSLTWDESGAEATITNQDEDTQTIKIKMTQTWNHAEIDGVAQTAEIDETGDNYILLSLNKGESKKVTFTYSDIPEGYYAVTADNKALETTEDSTEEGASLEVGDMIDAKSSSRWKITDYTTDLVSGNYDLSGTYKVIYTTASNGKNYYLNLHGQYKKNDNGLVQTYAGSNGINDKGQWFTFEETGDGDDSVYIVTTPTNIENNFTHVLGVDKTAADRSADANTVTHQVKNAGDAYQKWIITYIGDSYTIKNVGSGLYLDDNALSGSIIQRSPGDKIPKSTQIWQLVCINGIEYQYQLVHTMTGRKLTVSDNSVTATRKGSVFTIRDGKILTEDGSRALVVRDGILAVDDVENGATFRLLAQDETEVSYVPDALIISSSQAVNDKMTVQEGTTVRFTVSVQPEEASDATVDWVVTDIDGEEVDEITVNSGKVTFPYDRIGQQFYVYATSLNGTLISNKILITVVTDDIDVIHGDVNKDGRVTAVDALLCMLNPGEISLETGDMNEDGVVDQKDAKLILETATKLDGIS
ncbi:MAG: glycosyl hydrolase family 95 catalytic domain-containing protein [Lachnospiraceae bacterium]